MLALVTDDVTLLEELVSEALEIGHPERVRCVSRAVELQLGKLAIAEVRRGDGQPRIAGAASQRISERLRAWRAAEAEKSPLARKQRVQDRYQLRVNEARAVIERAARALNLDIG